MEERKKKTGERKEEGESEGRRAGRRERKKKRDRIEEEEKNDVKRRGRKGGRETGMKEISLPEYCGLLLLSLTKSRSDFLCPKHYVMLSARGISLPDWHFLLSL